MNEFLRGISYFLHGFKLITQPGLKRYVIIPLLMNIIFFIVLFFFLQYSTAKFNHWFASLLPNWLQWLHYVIWILFFLSFFIIFIYAFVTVANFICAPFNSLLAEKVEYYLTKKVAQPFSLMSNIKDTPRLLKRQFIILFHYIPRALLLLILLFIPIIHSIVPMIWFIFNAWFLALTYLDYPTDNHRIPITEVMSWLRQRRGLTLGFGISILIASMIPLVNFLTIPAAVAAATECWVRENQKITSL